MKFTYKQKNNNKSYDLLIMDQLSKTYILLENINLKNYPAIFRNAEIRRCGGLGYLKSFADFLNTKNYKRI